MVQKENLPPLRLKSVIPDGVFDLQNKLLNPDVQYLSSIHCPDCRRSLSLQDQKIEWPTDQPPVNFYMGPIPGYNCTDCKKTFLNQSSLEAITECLSKETGPYSFIKPDNIQPIN